MQFGCSSFHSCQWADYALRLEKESGISWRVGLSEGAVFDGSRLSGPTDEQVEIICSEVAAGWSMNAASATAELPFRTVQKWVQRGRDAIDKAERGEELTISEHRLASFAWAYGTAASKRGRVLETRMGDRADQDSGTWLAWFKKLERLHQAEWADHTKQAGPQGGVQIVIAGMLEPRVEVRQLPDVDARDRKELPPAPAPKSLPQ